MPTLAELSVDIKANLTPFNNTMKQAERQILDFQTKLNKAASGKGAAFSFPEIKGTIDDLKNLSKELKDVNSNIAFLSKTDIKFFNRVSSNIDHLNSRLNAFSKNVAETRDKIRGFNSQKFENARLASDIISLRKESRSLTESIDKLSKSFNAIKNLKSSGLDNFSAKAEKLTSITNGLSTKLVDFGKNLESVKTKTVDFADINLSFLDFGKTVNIATKELKDFNTEVKTLTSVNEKVRSFVKNFDQLETIAQKVLTNLPLIAIGFEEIGKVIPVNFESFKKDVQNLHIELKILSTIVNSLGSKFEKFSQLQKFKNDFVEVTNIVRKFEIALKSLSETINNIPDTNKIDFTSFAVQIIDLSNEAARLKMILAGVNKELRTLSVSNPKDFKKLGEDFRKSTKPADELLSTLGKIKLSFDTFDQNVNFNFSNALTEISALTTILNQAKEPFKEVAKSARILKQNLAELGKVRFSEKIEAVFERIQKSAAYVNPVIAQLEHNFKSLASLQFPDLTKLALQLNTISTAIKKISENLNKVQGEQRFARLASNLERLKVAATGLAVPLHEVADALNKIKAPDMGGFGSIFHQLRDDIRMLRTDMARLQASSRRTSSTRTSAASLGALGGAELSASSRYLSVGGPSILTGTLAGVVTGISVHQLQQYADSYTNLQNRLATTAALTGTYVASLDDLRKAANESNSALDTTANLYARLAFSGAKYLKNENEVMDLTKTLQKGLLLSGATHSETNSAITQFTQSLAAGRLNGDELRSLVENAPILINAIAKEFGVNPGDLKDMGARGELDIRRVLKAILAVTGDIDAAFKKIDKSIEATFQTLRNNFIMWIGRSDDVVEATEKINAVLMGVANNINAVATGAAAAAAVLLTMSTPMIAAALINPWVGLPVAIGVATGLIYKYGDEINVLENQTGTLGDAFDVIWSDLKENTLDTVEKVKPMFFDMMTSINEDLQNIDFDTVMDNGYKSVQKFMVETKYEFLLFVSIINSAVDAFVKGVKSVLSIGGLIPEEFGRRFSQLTSPLQTLLDVANALANKGVEQGVIQEDNPQAILLKKRREELDAIESGTRFTNRVATKNVENAFIEGNIKLTEDDKFGTAFDQFSKATDTFAGRVDQMIDLSKEGLSPDKSAGFGGAIPPDAYQYLLSRKASNLSDEAITKLTAPTAEAVAKWLQSLEKAGINAGQITSGYRGDEKQAQLYQDYLDGKGNLAAPPGKSTHRLGTTVDIMGLKNLSPEDYAIAVGLAQEQGIKFPVKSEKWHATYYGENAKYIKNATTGNSRKDPQFENDFERQRFNTEEDILRLNEQYDVLKSLNPLVDDYGYNLAFVEAKRKLLSDAEKEGLSLTPEQLQAVDELAKKYAEASAKVTKFTQEQQLANQRVENLRSTTKDVFGGMISDMKSGTSATEALANALDKIADKLMDMTLNFLFDTKSAGGSGIFDSLFQLGGDSIGKFFGSLFGADSGGYTGNVPTDQVTGWHHGQEYVLNANATRSIGVANLERMNATGKIPTIAVPNYKINKQQATPINLVIEASTDPSVIMNISDDRIRKAAPGIVTTSIVHSQKATRKNMGAMMTEAQNKVL